MSKVYHFVQGISGHSRVAVPQRVGISVHDPWVEVKDYHPDSCSPIEIYRKCRKHREYYSLFAKVITNVYENREI